MRITPLTSGVIPTPRAAARKPARFSRRKNGVPRGRNHTSDKAGRSRTAGSGARSAQKKSRNDDMQACLQYRSFQLFFVRPAQTSQPKRRFSRELEGGFYLKSRPSNVPHHFTSNAYTPTASLPQLLSKRTSTFFTPSGSCTRISISWLSQTRLIS